MSNHRADGVVAILPALDEEASVGAVVAELSAHVETVIVVDNGSCDDTAGVAERAGARVVREPERGYGAACLAGVAEAVSLNADIVVFLDADGSDDPSYTPRLVEPIRAGRADFVLGVRARHLREPGALNLQQRFGNWLVPKLMRLTTDTRYTDMPPFKAIGARELCSLGVGDRGHGFTVELLLRAHRERLRILEVPVPLRMRRGGHSKVSGTVRGTVRATAKIFRVVARHAVAHHLARLSS